MTKSLENGLKDANKNCCTTFVPTVNKNKIIFVDTLVQPTYRSPYKFNY